MPTTPAVGKEAKGDPITFEAAGQTWTLADFYWLDFMEALEQNRTVQAIKVALGPGEFDRARRYLKSYADTFAFSEAIAAAVQDGASTGE